MSTTSITTWERFADATFSHDQDAARKIGPELAASTPPVALAKRARHRKPNRRRSAIKTVLGSLLLVAAIFAYIATSAAAPRIQAPAYSGLTPSQVSQVAAMLEAPGSQLVSQVTVKR